MLSSIRRTPSYAWVIMAIAALMASFYGGNLYVFTFAVPSTIERLYNLDISKDSNGLKEFCAQGALESAPAELGHLRSEFGPVSAYRLQDWNFSFFGQEIYAMVKVTRKNTTRLELVRIDITLRPWSVKAVES